MINIEVNGKTVQAEAGEMLLTALDRAGIEVPTLCNMEGLPPTGACRMCVCEVEGQRTLVPACAFPIFDGMKVKTHSQRVLKARRTILELLLANHPTDCFYCERNGSCQLQSLSVELGIRSHRFTGEKDNHPIDESGPAIVRDSSKCILCGRCVRVCENIQSVSCLDYIRRGSKAFIGNAFNEGMNISSCINCGQCVAACPTGALTAKNDIAKVVAALNDPNLHVVIQHAPAVSVSLGEEFNLPLGADVMGTLHAALRKIGFDAVFDTSFAADLTIMEEATELVHRVTNNGVLPMFTSCSPGWIKFVETFYPEMMPHLSTCKSPQGMLGAVIKSCYAEKIGIEPKKIYSVSIMPCTAKKFEASRPELGRDGYQDIDAVLTTREAAQLFKMFGIDLAKLEPEGADSPFGERSTAGKLFGASGGVMEAAVRTAYKLISGEDLKELKIEALRGLEGWGKEAHLDINGLKVGVAVVNSLANARKIIELIKKGELKDIQFVEVMSCPGGCINGGGQPYGATAERVTARMQKLYNLDATESLRLSHENKELRRLYDEYLGKPNSEKAHHLLHTHYNQRNPLT